MALTFFGNTFGSLPVENSKYGFSMSRLQQLYQELVSEPEHEGSLAVVTLTLALSDDDVERSPIELTKAFEQSLRDELRWSINYRFRYDTGYFENNVRFVWAYNVDGESCSQTRKWRVAILLDFKIFYGMDEETDQFKNLVQMSWCRALGLSKFKPKLLVKLGRAPFVCLSKGDSTYFTDLEHTFRRLSVLAELPKNLMHRGVPRQSARELNSRKRDLKRQAAAV
ncbi:YagK/YfjJ domain-containing protein [Idiomarina sp.]|uniref:YagK/YfjJ domain-containing protein n=1 Tax=Idiomarina sp. TaxID=1874361 RepID=UPI003A920E97